MGGVEGTVTWEELGWGDAGDEGLPASGCSRSHGLLLAVWFITTSVKLKSPNSSRAILNVSFIFSMPSSLDTSPMIFLSKLN